MKRRGEILNYFLILFYRKHILRVLYDKSIGEPLTFYKNERNSNEQSFVVCFYIISIWVEGVKPV